MIFFGFIKKKKNHIFISLVIKIFRTVFVNRIFNKYITKKFKIIGIIEIIQHENAQGSFKVQRSKNHALSMKVTRTINLFLQSKSLKRTCTQHQRFIRVLVIHHYIISMCL